jgi:uncharacterized protein (DUF983 family)
MVSMRAPSPSAVLLRALRLRCPACGRGRVFRRGFERAPDCGSCGRRLDRDEGHWLGGSEIHMVLAFGASVAVAFPLVLAFDLPGAALDALALLHLAGSIAIYRHARALFLALDYALDPSGEARPGPGGGREPPGGPAPAPVPAPAGGRRFLTEERGEIRPQPVRRRPVLRAPAGPEEVPVLAGVDAQVE